MYMYTAFAPPWLFLFLVLFYNCMTIHQFDLRLPLGPDVDYVLANVIILGCFFFFDSMEVPH